MEFLKKLPPTAVISSDGEQFSFVDKNTGKPRNGYRVNISEPGSETVICNVTGELLERAMDNAGNLDKKRVILFFPEAKRLLSRHPESQKTSFSATFKQAHYQFQEPTGEIQTHCKVVVFDKRRKSKTFNGQDRTETLEKAVAWMQQFEEATLEISVSTKPVMKRTQIVKDNYEGRKHLTHVEVELHLEYLTEVDGWLLLPEGM
jgi:hypothetical protein